MADCSVDVDIVDRAFYLRVEMLLQEVQRGPLTANEPTRTLWTRLCDASRVGYNALFARLGVTVQERGESTYVTALPGVVQRLIDSGVAVKSEGAWVVPMESVNGAPAPPMIVQKSDGGCVLLRCPSPASFRVFFVRVCVCLDVSFCDYV